MKTILFSLLVAVALPSAAQTSSAALSRTPERVALHRGAQKDDTFFEGFEARPAGVSWQADAWLPTGWRYESHAGHKVPAAGSGVHNLTWRVTDENTDAPSPKYHAFEGQYCAFIMSDVAYTGHTGDAIETSDEWLITPDITPKNEDWLYFKLCYHPAWTVYNPSTRDFDRLNSALQVLASTDDGATWTPLWDITDELRANWTRESLEARLNSWEAASYTPIYVNLAAYVGTPVKLAFRYYGRLGHPMAIDNVAVGTPQPVASFALPGDAWMQGLSLNTEYAAEPSLLVPFGTPLVWKNLSTDALTYEWQFETEVGAAQSTDKHLTTPAYERGTRVATPTMQAFFESRASNVASKPYATMQVGGGFGRALDTNGHEGQFGAATCDVSDPEAKIKYNRDYIGFSPATDEAWETLLGRLAGGCIAKGVSLALPQTSVPYGLSDVSLAVYAPDTIAHPATLTLVVQNLTADGLPADTLATSALSTASITPSTKAYSTLHWDLSDAALTISRPVLVTITGFDKRDNILFPFVKTTNPLATCQTSIYMEVYDEDEGWNDSYYNLAYFPLNDGYTITGLLLNVGVSYSWLDTDLADIIAPEEGVASTFTFQTDHSADDIRFFAAGGSLPEWIEATVDPSGTLAIAVEPNDGAARETDLTMAVAGASKTIHVSQSENSTGIEGVRSVADGAQSAVYDLSGRRISTPKHGLYIIHDGRTAKKVVR